MAQQIKKKFIQNDAVDGQKIKLQKDQSIRGQKQDGSEVELLKLDGSDKLVSGGQELAFKEVVDAQVSDLQDKLDSEEASRQLEDQNLSTIIDEEVQSLTDLINEESSDIRSEFALADANLQSQVDTEKGRIDAILSASQADKDSFAEIVQLINSVDTENDSAFASYVLSNNAALAQEVSDRQSGDNTLQSNIDSEESRAMSAESALSGRVSTLEADAVTKTYVDTQDGLLQTAITAEETARIAGDAQLLATIENLDGYSMDVRDDLDTEIAARIAGDASLQSSLNQEISDRQAAVSSEASARQSADSIEQGARILADAELLEDVDTLTRMSNDRWGATQAADVAIRSEFAAADASLQSQVDTEKGRVDAILSASQADKDSFAEIVQLINSVDTENDSAFASYVLSNNQALADEVSARQSAVSAEESARIAADQDLQSQIDSEESRAMGVEEQLQTAVNGKVSKAGDEMSGSLTMTGTDGVVLGSQGLEIYGNGLESPATVTFNKDMLFMEQYGRSAELRRNSLYIDSGVHNMMLDQSDLSWNFHEGNSAAIGRGNLAIISTIENNDAEIGRYSFSFGGGFLPTIVQDFTGGAQNSVPFVPTEDQHIVVKQYVDQEVTDLQSQINSINSEIDGPYFEKQKFVINESSELSSIELSHECIENSLVVCVGRLMVHKDEDYSVSIVDGKSVLTWMGDFATGGSEAIEETDVIFVTFAREV